MPLRFALLLLSIFLFGTNGLILAPLIDPITGSLNAPPAAGIRAIAAFGFGTALSAYWFGRGLDRFGLHKSLTAALMAAALSHGLTLIAWDATSLALALFCSGCAAGAGLPATYALTTRLAEQGKTAQRMGQVLIGWSLGLVLAIPLGAIGAAQFGWETVFWVLIAVHGILGISILYLPAGTKPDTPPALVHRLAPLSVPDGWATFAICACFMASFHGLYALTGLYVIEDFGRSLSETGYIGLIYGITFAAASVASRGLDGFDWRKMQIRTLFIGAGVMTALALAPSFTLFIVCIGFWGAINHLNLNLILTRVGRLMPEQAGAAMGLYATITYLAATLATFAYSYLYDGPGFMAAALIGAALHIIAFGIARYSAAALA